jgi:hypothetical protein
LFDERRLGLSLTKIISKPDPSEKDTKEPEKFTNNEKEIIDQKSIDTSEKTIEMAEVSEDSVINSKNEEETEIKVKKNPSKNKSGDDPQEEESIQNVVETISEEVKGSTEGELSIPDKKIIESIKQKKESKKIKKKKKEEIKKQHTKKNQKKGKKKKQNKTHKQKKRRNKKKKRYNFK